MSMIAEHTRSLWFAGRIDAPAALSRPPLTEAVSADTIVVGAGIAGLSVAYALAKAGRAVVVIDDGIIGGGNTGRTTAHLSNVIDDRFRNLRRERGAEVARIAAESHGAAIDFIETLQSDLGIDCDFRRLDGYLILGTNETEAELDAECDAARDAGLAVEKLPQPPGGVPDRPCLRFARQARFEPLAYLEGLAKAIERLGGRIFGGTRVVAVKDGTPVEVEIAGGVRLTAADAVVATATPINDRVKMHTKIAPYRSYAIAARVEPGAIPDALIWDTEDPYHYVRLAAQGDRLYAILGGEDHKTGQTDDEAAALDRLETWSRRNFAIGQVDFRWSGQVMETVDGLGFIGRNPGEAHVYIATGDSGMGMTHGTIAGILIPALIEDGDHPWAKAYDPARLPIGAAGTFLHEQANVAKQFLDFVTPSDLPDMGMIADGEGAVFRHGASKVAAFRDDKGELHVRSAVCPHLGCIVHWNRLEKVWDCPCHGSQFGPTGDVLHGPAVTPLETVDDFTGQGNPNLRERQASG